MLSLPLPLNKMTIGTPYAACEGTTARRRVEILKLETAVSPWRLHSTKVRDVCNCLDTVQEIVNFSTASPKHYSA